MIKKEIAICILPKPYINKNNNSIMDNIISVAKKKGYNVIIK